MYTTGATTTLAGSGPGGYDGNGFHDGDNGANAQFGEPTGVAIDPDGTFALVAVRAPAPLHPARRGFHPQLRTRLAHTPHRPALPPFRWCPPPRTLPPALLLA